MKKLILILLLAVSFAFIEASVVQYLRVYFNQNENVKDVYSLNVIQQPETELDYDIMGTEIGREVATLLLFISMAWIVANSIKEWVEYFVFGFAIWDIFYYVWLAVIIDWPRSLLDWDILFLIPKAWYAPVIVPCIISLIGMAFSMIALKALKKDKTVKIQLYYWIPFVVSLIIWQISFLNKSNIQMTEFPESYSWLLFIIGVIISIVTLIFMYNNMILRSRNKESSLT